MDKEKVTNALRCCMEHETYEDCFDCPYRGNGCRRKSDKDILDLIENLQKDLAAALEDLKAHGDCTVCKNFNKGDLVKPCEVGGCCVDGKSDKWEWRGRQS